MNEKCAQPAKSQKNMGVKYSIGAMGATGATGSEEKEEEKETLKEKKTLRKNL